ncbi:MAG: Tetratricopeptide 2 repeat protein [Gemmatimonadetes bacterium]|nr:Tetratricopeptide 2 repeat protein [Gemmatimonadota bacterium]
MTASQRRWLPVATVALLALLATVTSIGHDFTYDDRGVIFENERVHSMLHLPRLWLETYWPAKYGGDGYRPIVMTLFTLQWTAANGAPWIFHLVNILLAVATSVAVYWCAAAVLPVMGAWVAAALFAVHPVHVEVTGNIVGQSELIVALCLSLAMGLYLRRRMATALTLRDSASITALFALGLLAKEHAIVLPGLMVAAELTVVPKESWRERMWTLRPLMLALCAVALGYLYVRGLVQADLAGFLPYPIFRFLHMSAADRIGTMMSEIPRIAQLLIFPTKLSADYSPNDVIVANGFSPFQLPGYFICVAIVLLALVMRHRAPVAAFGLVWTIVAFLPVSNLLVPAGFVTAERTLFFPSVGVVLVAGAVAEYARRRLAAGRLRLAAAGLMLLLAAGLARSIDRQRVWKNNDDFFVALMKDAPNGYRAHFLYARHIGLKSQLTWMEREYRRAIHIFPYDAGMTLSVADAYGRAGMCEPAVPLFEWTYAIEPSMGEGRYLYVYCLAKLGRWKDVRREAMVGMQYVPARDIHLMHQGIREANISLGRIPR